MLNETCKQNPPRWGEHVNSWLKVATHADDQLRQRVAYALSQFFVVSDQGGPGGQQAALSNYYDILTISCSSSEAPGLDSRPLYAGHHLPSKQVSGGLVLRAFISLRFY